eukprot:GEMP01000106.1.p1 GENE.GEMP01000106.1~~GEMP01000106.1.p1  ORF type:complete len:3173 (-),score=710.97 GEMP01000106.1:454-9972(-)
MSRRMIFLIWFVPPLLVAGQFLDSTKRELVRSLVRLNQAVGPRPRVFNYTVLAPIYDIEGGLFENLFHGDKELIFSEAYARSVAESEAVSADITEFYETVKDNLEEKFHPQSGVATNFGIGATKYEDADRRVIVFHGVESEASYHDMMLTTQSWFMNKMQPDMKTAWLTNVGALPNATASRELEDDMIPRVAILAGGWSLMVRKASREWDELDRNVDWKSLLRNGYWSTVKAMVREWMPAGRDIANEKTTIFTGHSQGGKYAQMVSMWLEKIDGKLYDAYSFNAPGVQCAVRYDNIIDYSDDMDVTISHSQIWQYVHVLDPIGNLDFTAGKVCKYGTTDLQTSPETQTQHFCGRIIGYPGSKFVFTSEVWKIFQQCLYFTHTVDSASAWLRMDSVLATNGDTDGGCSDSIIVPQDPASFCPPCASNRCSDPMPKSSFNWITPSQNPCVSGAERDVQLRMKTYEDTDLHLYDNCLVLGRNAYALIGNQEDTASHVRVVSIGFHYSLAQSLPVIDLKFAVGLQTLPSGTVRAVLHSPEHGGDRASPLFDITLHSNEKACSPSLFGIEFCIASSSAAAASRRELTHEEHNGTTSRDLIGFDLLYLFFTLGIKGSANGIVARIGQVSANMLMTPIPSTDVESMMVSRVVQEQVIAFQHGANSIIDLVTRSQKYPTHMCLPGETEAKMSLFDFAVSDEQGSTCMALGETMAMRLSAVNTEPPPPFVENNCFSTLRAIIAESFDDGMSLDGAILDYMVNDLFRFCTAVKNEGDCSAKMNPEDVPKPLCVWQNSHCDSVIKQELVDIGMYTTDVSEFLDKIEVCAKRIKPMSQLLCRAVANETLWPNVGSTEERKVQIKRAVHYTILLDALITVGRVEQDGQFVLNYLYPTWNPLIFDPNLRLTEVLNTFEMAKLLTVSGSLLTFRVPPQSCCNQVPGAFAFKVNVMEAVIEDLRLGFGGNAQAGLAMSMLPTRRVSTTFDHMEMYTSWNMAFVSHYDASPYFYSKLLTPQVLCADPKFYIFARLVGLYIHIWAVVLSRSNLGADPNSLAIIPDIKWNNPSLSSEWGLINKVHGDYWLQREMLPSFDGKSRIVRADIIYTIFGKSVSTVLVASINQDYDELRLTSSLDGLSESTMILHENTPSCLNLIGGIQLCFDVGATQSRRLQGGADPYTSVKTYVKGLDYQSPDLVLFASPTTHPCFTDAEEATEELFVQVADCTVLGAHSYLLSRNSCTDDVCEILIKVVLDNSGMFRRELQTSTVDFLNFTPHAHELRFSITQHDSRLRGLITSNGEILYDVDLEGDTSQCVGAQFFELCIARTSGENGDGDDADDQLRMAVNVIGVEREMILATVQSTGTMVFEEAKAWGLKTMKLPENKARSFDPCDTVTCGDNEVCSIGTVGQNPCFPSLFESYDNSPTPLVNQILHMAASPYAAFAIDVWQELGWTLILRECLLSQSDIAFLGWDTREDCMLLYSKVPAGATVPVCTLAFEGSDDDGEILEAALFWGRVLHHGYWIWRGISMGYEQFKQSHHWDATVRQLKDPQQCSQVYLTGHSVGASIAALFRLEYGFGRLVAFAMNNMFPPYFTPNFPMGDSFRIQLDFVQSLPPGWVSGGVREFMMCANGNLMSRGLNPPKMLGGKDYCKSSHHRDGAYIKWLADHLNLESGVEWGDCSYVDWVSSCVEDQCATPTQDGTNASGLCALGAEMLRATLLLQEKAAVVMNSLAATPSMEFWRDLKPQGKCFAKKHEGGGCFNIGGDAFLNFTSKLHNDVTTLSTDIELNPHLSEFFQLTIVLDPPTGALTVKASIGSYALPVSYNLPASSHYCPEALHLSAIFLCLVYADGKISVVAFVMDEIAYEVEIGRVVIVDGQIRLALSPPLARSVKFASQEQLFAAHSAMGTVTYPLDGFCNKVTSRCLDDNTCESWRGGAQCAVGVCTCGPGLCSNSQGVCVASEDPTALTLSQQPCIGPDQAFTPFVYLQDFSDGNPYDRCVILSKSSYIRFDFPTSAQATAAMVGLPLSFLAKLKLGLPTLPISFERVFGINVTFAFVPIFTTTTRLFVIDEATNTVSLLAEETFILSDAPTQEVCASLSSTGVATISLVDLCFSVSPVTPVTTRRRQLEATQRRSLAAQKFCSATDAAECSDTEVCKNEFSIEAANCTEALKNCVCVDTTGAPHNPSDDEPIVESQLDATINMPALKDVNKRRVPLATARSDGDVQVIVPMVQQKMVVEQTSEVPVTWLTPSIMVCIVFLSMTLISVCAGCLCGRYAKEMTESTSITECAKDRGVISRVKNKLSPIQFARDVNAESARYLIDEANQTWISLTYDKLRAFGAHINIVHPYLRLVFLNSFPSHLIRILCLGHDVNCINYFVEEAIAIKTTAYSLPVRRFLCWRRTVTVVVFVLSILILCIGIGEEWPRIISMITDEPEQMSNEELSRTVKLMSAFGNAAGRRLDDDDRIPSDLQQWDLLSHTTQNTTTDHDILGVTLRQLAEPLETDLTRARKLLGYLQTYATIMYAVKFVVTLVSIGTILQALRIWTDYRQSASWARWGLIVRVVITVIMTLLPWWFILFGDDREFPAYMKTSARLYMAFLVNVPLFTLSFMVTPALVTSSMIVIHLMPYTILPYMVITIGPMLAVISLWPMLSVIGHGSTNWLFLYGALIYSCYACVTALYSFRALQSMDALRTLGRRTFHNAQKESCEDKESQDDMPTLMNPLPVSPEATKLSATATIAEEPLEGRSWSPFECNMEQSMPTVVASRKTEPVVNFDSNMMDAAKMVGGQILVNTTTNAPLVSVAPNMDFVDSVHPPGEQNTSKRSNKQNLSSRRLFSSGQSHISHSGTPLTPSEKMEKEEENRRSSTMVEFERFASEKILNRGSELKVFRLSRSSIGNQEQTGAPSSSVIRPSVFRGSMEITELLVEGSLMADLREKMQPSMRQGFFVAQVLYFVGAILLLAAVILQSADVFEVMINGGSMWGFVIASVVECFVNKILMQMIFVDFLLNCIVKLRLFNGYMSDDMVLTDFVGLQGYATLLTEQFRKGVKEEEKIEEKRRSAFETAKALEYARRMSELDETNVDTSSFPSFRRRTTRSQSVPAYGVSELAKLDFQEVVVGGNVVTPAADADASGKEEPAVVTEDDGRISVDDARVSEGDGPAADDGVTSSQVTYLSTQQSTNTDNAPQ